MCREPQHLFRNLAPLSKILANLLDFVPCTATTLVLHVGTNDLASNTSHNAFDSLRSLIDDISKELPQIKRVYVSLVLPRSTNRRRQNFNHSFVRKFNLKAQQFNALLRDFCRHSWLVYFIDHGFYGLPSNRVLAADGLHLSFEGTAILASHLRQLLFTRVSDTTSSWRNSVPSASPAPVELTPESENGASADLQSSRNDSATWPPLNCPSAQSIPRAHAANSSSVNGLTSRQRPSNERLTTLPATSPTSKDKLQPTPVQVNPTSKCNNPATNPSPTAQPDAELQSTTKDSPSRPPCLQLQPTSPGHTTSTPASSAPTGLGPRYNLRTCNSRGQKAPRTQ